MNVAALVPTVAAVVAALFAVLSLLVASAPGWREYRWFALIAVSAAAYACCDIVPPIGRSAIAVAWASRVSLFMAGVHGYAWIRYMATAAHRANTSFESGVAYASVTVGALSLAPGVVITDHFSVHEVPWLGVSYADASATPFGLVTYLLAVLGLMVPLASYIRQWQKPAAKAHALALTCLIVMGANDAVVAGGYYPGPYLIDVGFLVVVVAVGSAMGLRFVASARALDRLSTDLEREVGERSRQLAEAESDARRNEKLAAIGRLAAGVAHEINNPAAAVLANLEYLRDELGEGQTLPPDTRACVDETLMSIRRIANIVRQLLDAGRVAGKKEPGESVHVGTIVANALALSRTTRDGEVAVRVEIPDDLCIEGAASLLEQVLVNLVANAGQALADARRPGVIEVHARASDGRVAIRIRDSANGIPPAAREHLFEPFFTTKAQNKGTGLGLAVSLGLVRALGGDLRVESTSPQGTTMLLDLPSPGPQLARH